MDSKALDSIVLLESIRSRCAVAPVSVATTYLSIVMFLPFIHNLGVGWTRILSWSIPVALLMLARAVFSGWVMRNLDSLNSRQLTKVDHMLRTSSVVNQLTVGMGIWIIGPDADNSLAVPLFVTLMVVVWSIGVMTNLFSDFTSFIISMPMLVIPNATFWLLHGDIGIVIGWSMLLATSLMLLLVRRGTDIFRSSVLIRFEKDQLLEQVEVERENAEKALQQAEAANESKAYFMAAAGHDIKQPLHALAILTDTLMMSNPTKSALSILEHQRRSIDQMTDHFDALMDLGRFQRGNMEHIDAHLKLGEFSARINSEIAGLCKEKGLRWNLDIDDETVVTDAELLLRLLRNLLTNAVRYTAEGSVGLSAKRNGKNVEVIVSDTGIGIAESQQKEVFKEFVRLEQDGEPSHGAGLGLSIAAEIDRALELDMQMNSIPGEGTEFRFQLPLAPEPA